MKRYIFQLGELTFSKEYSEEQNKNDLATEVGNFFIWECIKYVGLDSILELKKISENSFTDLLCLKGKKVGLIIGVPNFTVGDTIFTDGAWRGYNNSGYLGIPTLRIYNEEGFNTDQTFGTQSNNLIKYRIIDNIFEAKLINCWFEIFDIGNGVYGFSNIIPQQYRDKMIGIIDVSEDTKVMSYNFFNNTDCINAKNNILSGYVPTKCGVQSDNSVYISEAMFISENSTLKDSAIYYGKFPKIKLISNANFATSNHKAVNRIYCDDGKYYQQIYKEIWAEDDTDYEEIHVWW